MPATLLQTYYLTTTHLKSCESWAMGEINLLNCKKKLNAGHAPPQYKYRFQDPVHKDMAVTKST